jgi:hypothetical protein
MARAKVPLLTAAETAVNANAGSRAVSIVPESKSGQATDEVTLLQGTSFRGDGEARLNSSGGLY